MTPHTLFILCWFSSVNLLSKCKPSFAYCAWTHIVLWVACVTRRSYTWQLSEPVTIQLVSKLMVTRRILSRNLNWSCIVTTDEERTVFVLSCSFSDELRRPWITCYISVVSTGYIRLHLFVCIEYWMLYLSVCNLCSLESFYVFSGNVFGPL